MNFYNQQTIIHETPETTQIHALYDQAAVDGVIELDGFCLDLDTEDSTIHARLDFASAGPEELGASCSEMVRKIKAAATEKIDEIYNESYEATLQRVSDIVCKFVELNGAVCVEFLTLIVRVFRLYNIGAPQILIENEKEALVEAFVLNHIGRDVEIHTA